MIRQNFVDLSEGERDKLAAAFNHVNDSGLIATHAVTHDQYFSNGIHWRPQFLPWHRYFLRKLELALQEFDAEVMLPYWDWTQRGSQNLEEEGAWKEMFGGRDKTGGKFDDWDYLRNRCGDWTAGFTILPTMDHILVELNTTSFGEYRKVEGFNSGSLGSHVHAHPWVGGDMARGDSPRDPLFYLHHCNLDRLWSVWQLNNATAAQYDSITVIDSDGNASGAPIVTINGKMPEAKDPWENTPGFSGATPADMVDHRNLGYFLPQSGYTYQRDMMLEAAWQAKFGTEIITYSEPLIPVNPLTG